MSPFVPLQRRIQFRDILFNDTLDEIYDAFYENTVESLNVADLNLMGE